MILDCIIQCLNTSYVYNIMRKCTLSFKYSVININDFSIER